MLCIRWILPLVVVLVASSYDVVAREVQWLDDNWRFYLGEITQASERDFADDQWRVVNLPHDWSIEGTTAADAPSGRDGGYFPTGLGWYRRELDIKPEWRGKRVWLDFEGVATTCEIYLNGEKIGGHHYAYTPIHFDITEHLDFDGPNVIAVRVDNSQQPNSRWYTGSGIYRHVWLTVVEPVHVEHKLFYITTRPSNRFPPLESKIKTLAARIINKSTQSHDISVEFAILAADGKELLSGSELKSIPAGQIATMSQDFDTSGFEPWSPDEPILYTAVARVVTGGRTVDEVSLQFGIRTVEVTPEKGFLLNGEPIELIGACVHHDNGPLGAAAFDCAEERRVEMLKAAGFNAIRTSHNPPSTAFLDACDRLGMLVIDEAFDGWAAAKKEYDYSTVFKDEARNDLYAMIRRDKSHPSVVMWSIGNEVYERGNKEGQRIAKELAGVVRKLDPTRPVTIALNGLEKKEDWPKLDLVFAAVDVAGYNYELHRHAEDHQRLPQRIMYSSESFPSAAFESWQAVHEHPYVVGDFVWTGLDYLGEASIGRFFQPDEEVKQHWEAEHFPWHGAYCGDLDITGWRKPISHYRNIIWDRGEKLYAAVVVPTADGRPWGLGWWALPPALPSWTWPGQEGKPLTVDVFSRHDAVRLYLDDKLIGEQPTTEAEEFRAAFRVPYSPGVLRAVGIQGGKEVEEFVLKTAGPVRGLRLHPDREQISASGQDLSFIAVEVVDEHGNLRPDAEHSIQYEITGPGSIVGVGSGDLTRDHHTDRPLRRIGTCHRDNRISCHWRLSNSLAIKGACPAIGSGF
jgi:beta-galactosidase